MGGQEDPIRVIVLAASHALRLGLRLILAEEAGLQVDADAAGPAGLDPHSLPGAVILAAQPGPAFGAELQHALGDAAPYPPVLFLADEPAEIRTSARLPYRAVGILPVDASPQEITAALAALNEGLTVGAAALLPALIEPSPVGPGLPVASQDDEFPTERLTPREAEVLQLLAQGLPNKQIALALKISEHTVKFHISSIYSKLGATNRTEAVRAGARAGLIVL